MLKTIDFKQTISIPTGFSQGWANPAGKIAAILLMCGMSVAQADQAESSSGALCYECSAIIQHMALFQNGVLDDEAIHQIISNDLNYSFRLALSTICNSCLETLHFYEQNVIGRMLTEEQGKVFLESEEFLVQYNAVASISGEAFDPAPENLSYFFSSFPIPD